MTQSSETPGLEVLSGLRNMKAPDQEAEAQAEAEAEAEVEVVAEAVVAAIAAVAALAGARAQGRIWVNHQGDPFPDRFQNLDRHRPTRRRVPPGQCRDQSPGPGPDRGLRPNLLPRFAKAVCDFVKRWKWPKERVRKILKSRSILCVFFFAVFG